MPQKFQCFFYLRAKALDAEDGASCNLQCKRNGKEWVKNNNIFATVQNSKGRQVEDRKINLLTGHGVTTENGTRLLDATGLTLEDLQEHWTEGQPLLACPNCQTKALKWRDTYAQFQPLHSVLQLQDLELDFSRAAPAEIKKRNKHGLSVSNVQLRLPCVR